MLRRPLHLLIALACLFVASGAQAAVIVLYTYHLKPPYVVDSDRETGLYYDVANWLNQHSKKHRFSVEVIPRKRLDADLDADKLAGLVLGVNPVWFKDKARTRFGWSVPFMNDEDLVVSLRSKRIEYSGPASLAGYLVGLPAGYYYFGIDELVRAGKIRREDAASESLNLQKLASGRVDAIVISRPTLDYYLRQQPEWQGIFHLGATPHDVYERHILIPPAYVHLTADINAALQALNRDTRWRTTQDKYR